LFCGAFGIILLQERGRVVGYRGRAVGTRAVVTAVKAVARVLTVYLHDAQTGQTTKLAADISYCFNVDASEA